MYGMTGKLSAQPGQGEPLRELLLAAASILGGLEGCYLYLIYSPHDEPDLIQITEVWRSREDHQASLAMPEIRAIIQQAGPLLAASPQGYEIRPHGGVGLPE